MKFSAVNAVMLLLLTVLTGVFCMKRSKETAIANIDTIYNQFATGGMVRKHLNEVESILEKGYEDAQKTFADNANKEASPLDARQKLERQYVIEENSVKMMLSRAIDNVIGTWRKDNSESTAVLSSGVVLAHNESADTTKEVMTLIEKENLVFNRLPKVEVHNKNEEKPKQSKQSLNSGDFQKGDSVGRHLQSFRFVGSLLDMVAKKNSRPVIYLDY